MVVRSFQLSDYSLVMRLLQTSLSENCYDETLTAFGRQLSLDSDLVLIAETEGEPVGCIIGTIDKDNAYYYRTVIHPDHYGQGIGSALIEGLRGRFVNRKVKRIWIGVDSYNEAMLELYEKAGYAAEQFTRAISRLSIVAG